MSFVKILAPLTGAASDRTVLTSAISAALPFGGHVVGLFVRPDPALSVPFYAESVSSLVVQEVMDASREAAGQGARAARAGLQDLAASADIAVTQGCEKRDAPTVSYKEADGNFADGVALAARLSDLVVFAAPKEDERAGAAEAIEAAVLESRRPALLCARPLAPDFYERIAIGWNASVESAQAVSAALPLLKRAKSVELLAIANKDAPCAQCGEVVEYLALHGVTALVRELDAGGRPVAEVLLEAASRSASLLVLGGYGHSRWLELFQGGITRHAIAHADLPLFLVH